MVCVFGSFVVADDRAIKLIGLGLAVAVLIDATLVRMVLVPATMELLGRANWWMPRWLGRRLPRLAVEGPPAVMVTVPGAVPLPPPAPADRVVDERGEPVGAQR
jgi:RND superfamily putative drug exporter